MISYSYVYASLFRIAFGPRGSALPYKWRIRFAAVSGMLTTAFGLVVAFVPSRQVESFWRFEAKMFACCVALLGLAAVLFSYYSRQRVPAAALPVEA
jgi:hypothetical protein